MNLILVTCGTSFVDVDKLFSGSERAAAAFDPTKAEHWEQHGDLADSFARQHGEQIVDRLVAKSRDRAEQVTAELSSLRALFGRRRELLLAERTRLIFITSNTTGGEWSARWNQAAASRLWPEHDYDEDPHVIHGYVVDNLERFRSQGLPELGRLVLESWAACRQGPDSRLIFNVTGGFKAPLPFIGLLASASRGTVVYLYERSDELLVTPFPRIRLDAEAPHSDLRAFWPLLQQLQDLA